MTAQAKWSRNLLLETSLAQFQRLEGMEGSLLHNVGLEPPILPAPDVVRQSLELCAGMSLAHTIVEYALQARIQFGTCKRDDLVRCARGSEVVYGQVHLHVRAGECWSMISPWETAGKNQLRIKHDSVWVPTETVQGVLTWKKEGVTALIMPQRF